MNKQLYQDVKEALKKDMPYTEFTRRFKLDDINEIYKYAGSNFNLVWRDSCTPKWMYKLKSYRNFMLAGVHTAKYSNTTLLYSPPLN